MTPQQKQKIKNEYSHWLRESFSSGNHPGTDEMGNIIADYFLSILDKELEEERIRIGEKLNQLTTTTRVPGNLWNDGYFTAIHEVLDLIHNKS